MLARVGSILLEMRHNVWSQSHRREFQQNNLKISLHQPLPLGSDPASLFQTLNEMTSKKQDVFRMRIRHLFFSSHEMADNRMIFSGNSFYWHLPINDGLTGNYTVYRFR